MMNMALACVLQLESVKNLLQAKSIQAIIFRTQPDNRARICVLFTL